MERRNRKQWQLMAPRSKAPYMLKDDGLEDVLRTGKQ